MVCPDEMLPNVCSCDLHQNVDWLICHQNVNGQIFYQNTLYTKQHWPPHCPFNQGRPHPLHHLCPSLELPLSHQVEDHCRHTPWLLSKSYALSCASSASSLTPIWLLCCLVGMVKSKLWTKWMTKKYLNSSVNDGLIVFGFDLWVNGEIVESVDLIWI